MPFGFGNHPANIKPDVPSKPETEFRPARCSKAGIDLIKSFEGCRLTSYPDPGTGGFPWTIGWGTTRIAGAPVTPQMAITQAEADKLFLEDLRPRENEVYNTIGEAPTSQAQFDALVSFHYNTGAIKTATLTRKHKAGDYEGAAKEFGKWVNAGGRRMKGLVRRRAAEAAMYKGGS